MRALHIVAAAVVLVSLACNGPAPPPSPSPAPCPSCEPTPCPASAPTVCPNTCPRCPGCPVSSTEASWSDPVKGLRARLIAHRLPDEEGHPQVSLDLELQSVRTSLGPILIHWEDFDDALDFRLTDASGNVFDKMGFPGNHFTIETELSLVNDSTMHLTMTRQAYEKAGVLRPTTFQGWVLPATARGPFSLSATLHARARPDAGRRSWSGPMDLPAVAIP